eukprot:CAMPEP_0167793914 /NCGR_PEP_ID=MMETSP0111_2-20121227/13499_1 /TAXON_ID=91324 /ORGANISM="Lotharella globosa, Strain CCCM811" /LENGTH=479 /DNA_ID=CAMNT_0007687233 /DNA_START=1 /DNA_END=1438 /DNA_ORIENTATION=-
MRKDTPFMSTLKSVAKTVGFVSFCGGCVIFISLGNARREDSPLMKALMQLDPETAHKVSVYGASCSYRTREFLGLVESDVRRMQIEDMLSVDFCGMTMKNCIGLAAGYDKNAQAMQGMLDMGFGFVEAGTVTPLPQPGNPKPRVFRLPEQKCVINRYGFNSEGHKAFEERFKTESEYKRLFQPGRIIGINIGKNKTQTDAISDYVKGVELLGPYADYLVVNVSSPNTPGLRDLQSEKQLRALLTAVMQSRNALPRRTPIDYVEQKKQRKERWVWTWKHQLGLTLHEEEPLMDLAKAKRPELPPLFVKIAPDVNKENLESIAQVVMETKVDGIVISNTTIRRDFGFEHKNLNEKGGLSGPVLREMSNQVISDFYRLTNGKIPIIGVGGVSSGKDALEKIKAGASVVQLYTGLIFGGPILVSNIKSELVALLTEQNYSHEAKLLEQITGENSPQTDPHLIWAMLVDIHAMPFAMLVSSQPT